MLFVAFIVAGAIATFLMPGIIRYARKHELFDAIGGRKIHTAETPRLGGLGIFIAFMLTILFLAIFESLSGMAIDTDLRYWPIFVGVITIFVLGFVDDLHNLKARFKCLVQLGAAILVVAMGFRFRVVLVPWGDRLLYLGVFSAPITIAWIVGITNAMNLIDGMDGLAGGIAVLSASTFGLFFIYSGDLSSAAICFALAGAVVGFLIFNMPPARIFMGDAGSLFIGFALSVLPLLSQTETKVEIGLFSAITALGIPIIDTLSAIYRRTKAGVHFFIADRGHIHHLLLDLGFPVQGVLARILIMCVFLDLAAISSLKFNVKINFVLKIAAILVLFFSYRLLYSKAREKSGRASGDVLPTRRE